MLLLLLLLLLSGLVASSRIRVVVDARMAGEFV